ncbi:MAG TPA: helix-turn-helix domain-containing protein [Hyphomonadaceae bacterium]|jgi:AcrR family transcriptional regulator|nr:helix-turn-helix domain-containing protein [Hyphomonadaceae bacterium]
MPDTLSLRKSARARKPRKRASRLSPDARKELILSAAAEQVIAHGISGLSVEDVARAAKVSKTLVYKYFPNRDEMLAALLRREFEYMKWFNKPPEKSALKVSSTGANRRSLDDALQQGVSQYLTYLVERGGLFQMLINDGSVAEQVQRELRAGRGLNMQYWTQHAIDAYGIPYELARICVIMATRALEGAQGSVRSGRIDPDYLSEAWTVFLRAGWKAVGKKYGKQ